MFKLDLTTTLKYTSFVSTLLNFTDKEKTRYLIPIVSWVEVIGLLRHFDL